MKNEKMKIPVEIKNAIDGLLAPYGLSMDQINSKPEEKPSLDTVYLTVQQAEDYTHYKRWSLRQHAKAGHFRTIKTAKARGGKVLIDKASLDDWLAGK